MSIMKNSHHQLLLRFPLWQGTIPEGFYADFLGILTRNYYEEGLHDESNSNTNLSARLPSFDEEYFEWIDLLESVAAATNNFTMIELGAGYGRWLVRAAFVNRRLNNVPCKLIGVEGEPTHFQWMNQHFADNDLIHTENRLIEAAVSDRDGETWFNVGRPNDWYGQRIVKYKDIAPIAKDWIFGIATKSIGKPITRPGFESHKVVTVPAVSLKTLLDPLKTVDLIDLDIQGSEFLVLRAGTGELNTKVRRIHVETHSGAVEKNLRVLFKNLGWRLNFDFACHKEQNTQWGIIYFQGGVQSWTNPNLKD